MRSVDKKVCLFPSILQKQIKNRLKFSVASLGIHHGLHLAWHGFVEQVEVLRSDAHSIPLPNFFQLFCQCATHVRSCRDCTPLHLKQELHPYHSKRAYYLKTWFRNQIEIETKQVRIVPKDKTKIFTLFFPFCKKQTFSFL